MKLSSLALSLLLAAGAHSAFAAPPKPFLWENATVYFLLTDRFANGDKSNDLAYGLKVPLGRAEQLKIEHGSAFVEGLQEKSVTISNEVGMPLKTVNLEHLRRIMSLRLEEIFQLIAADLDQAGLLQHLRAGVFLCGGGARISQIASLAEHILELPVSVGKSKCLSGLKSALDQPEFATAIGLVKFGSFQQRKRGARSLAPRSLHWRSV